MKAHKIVEWRNAHGPFLNRAQLKAIKGLGPKAFEQCAGFVRVLPGTRASCTETYVQVHHAVLWKYVQHIVQSKQYYYLLFIWIFILKVIDNNYVNYCQM